MRVNFSDDVKNLHGAPHTRGVMLPETALEMDVFSHLLSTHNSLIV